VKETKTRTGHSKTTKLGKRKSKLDKKSEFNNKPTWKKLKTKGVKHHKCALHNTPCHLLVTFIRRGMLN